MRVTPTKFWTKACWPKWVGLLGMSATQALSAYSGIVFNIPQVKDHKESVRNPDTQCNVCTNDLVRLHLNIANWLKLVCTQKVGAYLVGLDAVKPGLRTLILQNHERSAKLVESDHRSDTHGWWELSLVIRKDARWRIQRLLLALRCAAVGSMMEVSSSKKPASPLYLDLDFSTQQVQ